MVLAFTIPHLGFTGLPVAALLLYAWETFLLRRPSFPIALAYTDEEKESYRKAIEATFGKAVLFPRLFHEMTSMDNE